MNGNLLFIVMAGGALGAGMRHLIGGWLLRPWGVPGCAQDDGGMAADRAFFQHDALQLAAVFQKLGRADVAGDQDRIVGHLRAGVAA